ncbi:MAG: phenylphosphate synthase subunit beta [Chloroflexi bacterium]|nr:phenylphosphate synthase subunit beta [Chloroflexota bacterium]
MAYVLGFDKIDKESLPIVGGKNASLGEMLKSGIRVPPGFAITTESYLELITSAGIADEIQNILAHVNPDSVPSLDHSSEQIQTLIMHAAMPSEIRRSIAINYENLCDMCSLDDLPVAVRSSATAEDLPNASFAGQQDTYLWVRGLAQVIHMAQKCWASLFTARAIGYRAKMNFPHDKVLISVGVQKMVNSRTSGVMFTLNPLNGDPSRVVVEGSWGFGEAVVSGAVTPDKFVVDKVCFEINERIISAKTIECIFQPGKGVVHSDVDATRQTQPSMNDKELIELVQIAKRIEDHYGRPMDIEWAIDHDLLFPENVFIVQSRPETVWSQKPKQSVLGNKSGYELLMEKALSQIKISN